MGRKPIRKKGAMTAAERQRRRRKRLRADRREVLKEQQRAENHARYLAHMERHGLKERPPVEPCQPPLPDRADEIAWQIAEVMAADPELTIDDIRAALVRRFGEA
jgi:hypothetical protein